MEWFWSWHVPNLGGFGAKVEPYFWVENACIQSQSEVMVLSLQNPYLGSKLETNVPTEEGGGGRGDQPWNQDPKDYAHMSKGTNPLPGWTKI